MFMIFVIMFPIEYIVSPDVEDERRIHSKRGSALQVTRGSINARKVQDSHAWRSPCVDIQTQTHIFHQRCNLMLMQEKCSFCLLKLAVIVINRFCSGLGHFLLASCCTQCTVLLEHNRSTLLILSAVKQDSRGHCLILCFVQDGVIKANNGWRCGVNCRFVHRYFECFIRFKAQQHGLIRSITRGPTLCSTGRPPETTIKVLGTMAITSGDKAARPWPFTRLFAAKAFVATQESSKSTTISTRFLPAAGPTEITRGEAI